VKKLPNIEHFVVRLADFGLRTAISHGTRPNRESSPNVANLSRQIQKLLLIT
jgi:hypothetical protein